MSNLNKVNLIGHVGKDPEIRAFQTGGRVASFSLATTDTWRDRTTGGKKQKTEWHRIIVTNEAIVGIIERWVKKGAKLYIEGQIATRKWKTQDGAERSSTEIVIRPHRGELIILDNKQKEEDAASSTIPDLTYSEAVDDCIPF